MTTASDHPHHRKESADRMEAECQAMYHAHPHQWRESEWRHGWRTSTYLSYLAADEDHPPSEGTLHG